MSNGTDDDKTPQDERLESERRQKERDREALITFRVEEAVRTRLFRLVKVIATVLSIAAAMAAVFGFKGYQQFQDDVRDEVTKVVTKTIMANAQIQGEMHERSFKIVNDLAREMLTDAIQANKEMAVAVEENIRMLETVRPEVDSLTRTVKEETIRFALEMEVSQGKLDLTVAAMDSIENRVNKAREGADEAEARVDALADSSRSKLDSIGKEYTDLADRADKVLVRADNAADSMHAVFSEANQELSTFRKTAEKANYGDFVKDLKGMKKEADEQRKKLDKTRKNSDKTYGNLEDMMEQLENLERKLKKLKSEVKDNCDYFDQLLRSRDSTATASLSHGN